MREFFPRNHPILSETEETEQKFQLAESPNFFVSLTLKKSQRGHWLTPARIAQLDKVTQALSSIQGIKEVKSLSNLEMAIENSSTLQIGPVLKSIPRGQWVSYIRSQPLLKSQLISEDLRSVLLSVEPVVHDTDSLLRIENELREKAARSPLWEVNVAGVPAVQARLAEKLGQEIVKFLGLSLLLFCLMFFAFYRNLSPVLFAAAGLIVANVTSLAWLGSLGIPFTILLSTLPIIVSISFVSLAIHTFHLWADRAKETPMTTYLERQKRSWHTLRELALPNCLGSATTAIGFAVLATANIPAIRTYAIVIAGVVMWTWFITQIMLLGFMHFFIPEPRQWNHARAWWMLKINRFSIPVVSVTIGVCVVLGATVSKMNFSGRLFDDLPKKELVRRATERMDLKFGGTVALDVALVAKNPDAWKDPKILQKLEGALQQLRQIPGIGSVLGVTDFMGGKVPETPQAVAEVYFLFSMAPENPLRHFVNADFKETRVAARLRDLPSSQVLNIRSQVRDVLSTIDPNITLRESGLAVNSHTLNQEVAKELVYGFWQSLVIIGLLLMIIFRSVRWALLACLPNFVPPAILIGTLVLFQTPVKPGIALIFSIALGLAFNNTVYLLSRLKRIQREKNMKTLPLRRALLEEGNPCFSESFVMFVGFVIFLSSDFKLNQTFGAYMILSIIAGALGDLVFLPAILREFSSFLWVKRKAKDALQVIPKQARRFSNLFKASIAAGVAALLIAALMIFSAHQAKAAPVHRKPAQAKAAVAAPVPAKTVKSAGGTEVKEILDRARAQLDSKNDQAKVVLKIIEANGEVKTREMTLSTLRMNDGFKAIVRIQAPADIKGTALLAEVDKGGEQRQWLYLPSSKQVRRVATATKSTGVLGSELSPEDLNPVAIKGARVKLLKKDAETAVIAVTPAKGTSEYSQVQTTFSIAQGLPLKTEYFSGDKVKKTVEFLNYTTVGKISRAQLIKVKNLEKNRGTDIELSDLKVNTGLTAKDFTESALKDTW